MCKDMIAVEGQATLEEAVQRTVITLERGNIFADAVRRSHFLNCYDRNNSQGVLPIGDDLLELRAFSSGEYAITLLPEEVIGNGETNPHSYANHNGERVRFFNKEEGNELAGKTVYIIATPSINADWKPDQIVFRMQIATRTAKHLGAKKVYAVFSEFPFARQDRGISLYNREKAGSSREEDKKKHAGQTDYVSSVLLGLMIHGCDGVVTLHHHSGHVQETASDCLGVLGRRRDARYVFDLSPTPLIARYLQIADIISENERANNGEGIIFIAPDEGAIPFVESVKEMTGYTNAGFAHIDKKRLRANDEGALKGILVPGEGFTGDYEGKVGIVLDDMIDTFGTANNALNKFPRELTRVIMYATHGIFAGRAEDLLRKHKRVSDVIVMDTRPGGLRILGAGPKRKVIPLQPAHYFAHALAHCVEQNKAPIAFYAQLFRDQPAYFDNLFKVNFFSQHYSKTRQ